MGQTAVMLPRLKRAYRQIVRSKTIDHTVHAVLNVAVGAASAIAGYAFPKKYGWDWKLEVLLRKYETDVVRVCGRRLKPGMIAIDVGAHIGYFARLFSGLVGRDGRVYAFEADPTNFALLKKNVSRKKNVTAVHQAVADKNGALTFFESPTHTGFHSLLSGEHLTKTLTVPATTLDNFFGANMPRVDFIKMDIEGAEPLALAGMAGILAASPRLIMILEFCPEHLRRGTVSPQAFLKSLRDLGFTLHVIGPDGPVPLDDGRDLRRGSLNLLCVRDAG